MRFLRLDLTAVGPFTGVSLDLSAGQHGLHLIHGPNEAGKSSTLRALSYLLYGFPARTQDDFVHPYDQLRVGAALRHSDGEVLEIIRRKANKNPLRGPDDAAVVGPERLERFLGGLDQDSFETLFGIDHARLARAGDEIRTGQGRLGELLFTAGTGLAGLRQAQERLQEQLDALFKPRGQNPKINQALAELRTGQEQLRKVQLSSEAWQQHDQAYREAQEQAARLGTEITRCNRERNRLDRTRAAVPLAARRRMLRAGLDALGGVLRLRDDFGNDCRAAQETRQLAVHTITQALAARDSLATQLAAIEPPRDLLDAAEEIEALSGRLGAVEKAQKDRGGLESMLGEHAHQSRRLLRELGRSTDLDTAESSRLRADEPAIIRDLAKQSAAQAAAREGTLKTVARLEDLVERTERKAAELGEPRDVEPLRHAVRQARKAGDLDERYDQARAAQGRSEKAASRALGRLPGWSGTLDDLERLAVPLDATLDRFETAIQAAEAALRALDDKRTAEGEEISRLEAQIQALDLQQDVPTEQDLHAARDHRDATWKRILSAWLGGDAAMSGTASGRDLAEAFAQSQALADTLADRLRREADRVTRKTEWLSQLDRYRASRAVRNQAHDEAAARLAALHTEWTGTAGSLGVPSATPAELRAWLRRREEVVLLAGQARADQQALEPLEQSRNGHREALKRALVALGESAPGDESLLSGWLARADDVLEREDKAARSRDKLRGQAEEARAELVREQLGRKAAEAGLAAWRIRWAEMMERLGLEPGAATEQAEMILQKTQELFEELSKHRDFQSRIRGIDRDNQQFAADVGDLARRVAPDLDGQPAENQARELARRLRDARAVQAQNAALSKQRDGEQRRLREAENQRDTATLRLESLCHEAGVDSPDDLAEAVRRSAERGRLEDDLRNCEDNLLALSGGLDADRFAAEVEQADADALGPAVERLDLELGALEKERERVNQTIGAERLELDRMDGDDRAAAAAEAIQTTLAQLHVDVGRYSALKLAAAVLQRGIERYREKNQGPILKCAGRLFADLTGGSFAGLQIDDDGAGAVLKGVRPDRRLVGVEGMSSGSHDQLYLALRLASLESWLQAHEPIPFVVDDILMTFDDPRALAALRALVELSQHTQVLFFTHHRHLVELAEENLPNSVLFVHELPAGRVAEVAGAVPVS